jgi:hypothetical protein
MASYQGGVVSVCGFSRTETAASKYGPSPCQKGSGYTALAYRFHKNFEFPFSAS